ncbi:MAG: methionyl-tRNA formyltransferase [Acutalibacteraceae bacterium]|nr:methionyl-tRNA formyltransferase [Acutalibacteraceae bacterium]
MKIVFMGTPDYAVPTLKALIEDGHEIAAVFCQPDKPVGRKKILTAPAVKVCAEEYNIPVYQPQSVKTDEVYDTLLSFKPDVIVVVAYGKILPERVLNIAPYGCINGHGSILPRYRGAAPIQWAVINGETETGVTAMYMDSGIDTGDIIDIEKTQIGENETADMLFERLSVITAKLLSKTIKKLQNGEISRVKQSEAEATYAPIISKDMALIDFSKSADEVRNAVRGFNSWPVAYCFLDSKRLKVFSCSVVKGTFSDCGKVVKSDGQLVVSCGQNAVAFEEIQLEGSKRMNITDFLKGKTIPVGTSLVEE